MDLATNLRQYVLSEQAEGMLRRYLDRESFSGCWFDIIGGRGDADPVANRFTAADIVAVSTLSVNVPGWAAIALLDRRDEDYGSRLAPRCRNGPPLLRPCGTVRTQHEQG